MKRKRRKNKRRKNKRIAYTYASNENQGGILLPVPYGFKFKKQKRRKKMARRPKRTVVKKRSFNRTSKKTSSNFLSPIKESFIISAIAVGTNYVKNSILNLHMYNKSGEKYTPNYAYSILPILIGLGLDSISKGSNEHIKIGLIVNGMMSLIEQMFSNDSEKKAVISLIEEGKISTLGADSDYQPINFDYSNELIYPESTGSSTASTAGLGSNETYVKI